MQHLVNTARGKLAKNQQELLSIAMNQSPVRTEVMDHPICEVGFSKYGEDGMERMDDVTFIGTVMTLMKSRPSSRLWDVVPDAPYHEDPVLVESPEAFKMTFEEKAHFLRDEFMRRPNMAGFKIELHNVERKTDSGRASAPSLSFTIYETDDDLGGAVVPVKITTKYRTNF